MKTFRWFSFSNSISIPQLILLTHPTNCRVYHNLRTRPWHSWSVQCEIKSDLSSSTSHSKKIWPYKLSKPLMWRLPRIQPGGYNPEILSSYNWQLRHHQSATEETWPPVLEFTRRPAWCPAPRWLGLSYNYWEDQRLLQLCKLYTAI